MGSEVSQDRIPIEVVLYFFRDSKRRKIISFEFSETVADKFPASKQMFLNIF